MTDEITNLMERRRSIKDIDTNAYKEINKIIKRECKAEKEIWIGKICEEVNQRINYDPRAI